MEHPNVYAALSAAQADCGPLIKKANNPFFKSKYADLNSVLDLITTPCAEHGLMFFQAPNMSAGVPVLTTTLVHIATGETIESEYILVNLDKAQDVGSAITYGRRYSLVALFNLCAEDDDGNSASNRRAPAESLQRKSAPKPEMWTANIGTMMLIADERDKKKLASLAMEAIQGHWPTAYVDELIDAVDDPKFTKYVNDSLVGETSK